MKPNKQQLRRLGSMTFLARIFSGNFSFCFAVFRLFLVYFFLRCSSHKECSALSWRKPSLFSLNQLLLYSSVRLCVLFRLLFGFPFLLRCLLQFSIFILWSVFFWFLRVFWDLFSCGLSFFAFWIFSHFCFFDFWFLAILRRCFLSFSALFEGLSVIFFACFWG